jgi:CheY-like chemotaxis protein
MSLRQHTGMELHSPEPIEILYLDDDPEDAAKLGNHLAPSIVNPVICFSTSRELYDYLDAHTGRPFIVLIDLVLVNDGDGGGYQVIRELRKRADLAETQAPILAVTATQPDDYLIELVRKTGADAFIHKPVRVDDLVSALGRPGWYGRFQVEISRGRTPC